MNNEVAKETTQEVEVDATRESISATEAILKRNRKDVESSSKKAKTTQNENFQETEVTHFTPKKTMEFEQLYSPLSSGYFSEYIEEELEIQYSLGSTQTTRTADRKDKYVRNSSEKEKNVAQSIVDEMASPSTQTQHLYPAYIFAEEISSDFEPPTDTSNESEVALLLEASSDDCIQNSFKTNKTFNADWNDGLPELCSESDLCNDVMDDSDYKLRLDESLSEEQCVPNDPIKNITYRGNVGSETLTVVALPEHFYEPDNLRDASVNSECIPSSVENSSDEQYMPSNSKKKKIHKRNDDCKRNTLRKNKSLMANWKDGLPEHCSESDSCNDAVDDSDYTQILDESSFNEQIKNLTYKGEADSETSTVRYSPEINYNSDNQNDDSDNSEYIPSSGDNSSDEQYMPSSSKKKKIHKGSDDCRQNTLRKNKYRMADWKDGLPEHCSEINSDSDNENDASDNSEYIPSSGQNSYDAQHMPTNFKKKTNHKGNAEFGTFIHEDSYGSFEIMSSRKGSKGKREYKCSSESSSEDEPQGIGIPYAVKSPTGKRVWDKVHCCLYCHKLLKKLSQHLVQAHIKEIEVARILGYEKGSKERKEAFELLTREGDFYYNKDVECNKSGTYILLRRPSAHETVGKTYSDYGNCPRCLGYVLTAELHRHLKNYPVEKKNPRKGMGKHIKTESRLLMLPFLCPGTSEEFQCKFLAHMRSDYISEVAQTDWLIMMLGSFLFDKYKETQKQLISQTIRALSRLLIEYRAIEKRPTVQLQDCIHPKNFDKVIRAVQSVCGSSISANNEKEVKIPSLALNIGHGLRKCANILKGKALRDSDRFLKEECESFMELLNIEWASRISKHALSTLSSRKQNKPELLPRTEDLVKLCDFQKTEIEKLLEEFSSRCNSQKWQRLAQFSLARLILFNKRRGGEMAKMLLRDFNLCPDWQKSSSEFQSSLSSLEKQLCNRLKLVEIRGKRGRKVPVLIPPDAYKAIKLLIQFRDDVGVDANNPYIFARLSGKMHLRGNDCMKAIVSEADFLENPELVTSTKLRKYIATICQVMDLKEVEIDWLARHLGHDVRVHRDFYRLHESTAELAKVSKLLLAAEKGELHKWAGKQLDEVSVDVGPVHNVSLFEDSDAGHNSPTKTAPDNAVHLDQDIRRPAQVERKGKRTFGQKVKGARSAVVEWSPACKKAMETYFAMSISSCTVPGKEKCESFLQTHANLVNPEREWRSIKYWVYNRIQTRKRKLSTS